MMPRRISVYTPSNTDPAVLKRIFVQRHTLLRKLTDRLARSMTSPKKDQIMLIGPRGCGKTHMVSLIAYELRQRPELSDVMRIAWLGEDDTIAGLIDLAFAIAKQLAHDYPTEFPADYRSAVRGMSRQDAAESVLTTVMQQLGERNIVLIMENVDRAFQGLGDVGRQRWRAFLQEHRRMAILGTSQQLFQGISSRDEAFFGFFDIRHLSPLDVDTAHELIVKISRELGKDELSSFLDTSQGHYRTRALHHLAGGNHRLYVLLSEFLTEASLNDLVAAFETLAEELTPYFQERIRSLPPQQARIIESLCGATGTLTVKEVAEDTFIAVGNCSKQLGQLKSKGYVRTHRRGKESFYEVAEPLMRLCLEVKQQRGRPLRLVAQFLRAWFSDDELRDGQAGATTSPYRALALQLPREFDRFVAAALEGEIADCMAANELDRASELVAQLRHADPVAAEPIGVDIAFLKGDYLDVISQSTAIIASKTQPTHARNRALLNRACCHLIQGDFDKGLADVSLGIDQQPASIELWTSALLLRGAIHEQRGEQDAMMADYATVVRMEASPGELLPKTLIKRAQWHDRQGDTDRALLDYCAVIDMEDATIEQRAVSLRARASNYSERVDLERELLDRTAVVEMEYGSVDARAGDLLFRGSAYRKRGQSTQAFGDYTAVVEMKDVTPRLMAVAFMLRSAWFASAHRHEQSQDDLQAALALPENDSRMRTFLLFALTRPMVATSTLAEVTDALTTAFTEGAKDTPEYGGNPPDLLRMVLRRGYQDWPAYILMLAPLYIAHGAAARLGQGLIHCIEVLDGGDYSDAQLDAWNSAWQEVGAGCDALEIPLLGLYAAVEAIKAGSDRPLLRLATEIREIVQPLLRQSLAER